MVEHDLDGTARLARTSARQLEKRGRLIRQRKREIKEFDKLDCVARKRQRVKNKEWTKNRNYLKMQLTNVIDHVWKLNNHKTDKD